MLNRRDCLVGAAALGALNLVRPTAQAAENAAWRRIHIFTKPIQSLSFQEVADHMVAWDVGGLEATVREGGWILPADAPAKLPQLMESLQKVDRTGMILTVDLNDADHPDVKRVMEPASQLKMRYLRMAYYKYDLSKKILPQLEQFAKQATGLARVCKELNMTALYQNHAGATNVGGPLWDLMEVLRGIDPAQMSVAMDIRHTTVEATESWKAGYARLKEHIGAVFVKDAIITDGKPDDGPLGRSAKCKQLFEMINRDLPQIPISLHMEYMDHRKPELVQQRLEAITSDVKTLKSWMA